MSKDFFPQTSYYANATVYLSALVQVCLGETRRDKSLLKTRSECRNLQNVQLSKAKSKKIPEV